MLPPVETNMSKHTNASSRKPAGGLTRREEAVELERSGLAERGNVPQSCGQTPLTRELRESLAALRVQEESRKRHARKRSAQREHVPLACSCSNPCRDDLATSTAWNCSTASPVPHSSWRRSPMHTPRERRRVLPERIAWLDASSVNLSAQRVRVKEVSAN